MITRDTSEGHVPARTSYSPRKQSSLRAASCFEPTQSTEDRHQVAELIFICATFMKISRVDVMSVLASILSKGKGTLADRSNSQARHAKCRADLESLAHHHVVPHMPTRCSPNTFNKRSRNRSEASKPIGRDLKHVISRRRLYSDRCKC